MRKNGPGCDRPAGTGPDSAATVTGSISPESSRNELSGVVHGSAIQAGSIHGDVHFSLTEPASFRLPVPAQLPSPPANFTGRAEELAGLDGFASCYDPVRRLAVAVIVGAGGTGKTSLASRWLHALSDHYDGGALFTDLRGHVPEAAARPSEVLTAFLRALGTPPEQIPLALDEQIGLYRSVTSGRRMIVLLDNAASAAQVRCLLPGPGPRPRTGAQPGDDGRARPSLVVVTTRWQITGLITDGAEFITLGPLDERSARELFGKVVGTDRAAADAAAADSVVRLCGGLPLAVCVAGARLAQHPRWPVRQVADELASERHRLAALTIAGDLSVRATFDLSYQALSPEVARLYRLVSVLPSPDFSTEVAAAAVATDAGRVGELLEELASASLLEETGERRFRFHDLVRLHASGRAEIDPADEREAVMARAVGWYLRKAVDADLVIIPGRWRLNPMFGQARSAPPTYQDATAALHWLESELPGLAAAVRTAHGQGLHEQTWQLCEALWGLFANRNFFRPWIDTHQLGVTSAQACGNLRAEARMRMQLGLAYLHLGRPAQAREQYTRALALDRQDGHRLGEATELEQLGLTDLAEGRTGAAIEAFSQARIIFEEINVPRGSAMMACHLGEAHGEAGRFEEAIGYLHEARRLFAELPDAYNEARAVTGLGQTHLRAGRLRDALPLLTSALTVMTSLDSPYEQARIRVSLADAVGKLGDPAQARHHLEHALAIYDGLGAPEAEDARRRLGEPGPADTDAGQTSA